MIDILKTDRRVTEIYGYLSNLLVKGTPHYQDIVKLAEYFEEDATALINTCGTRTKGFTSAPVRAAAVMAMECGEDKDYVLRLYRNLALLKYDQQPPVGVSFSRMANQLYQGKTGLGSRLQETYVRARYVFTERHADFKVIRITDEYRDQIMEFTRQLIREITS